MENKLPEDYQLEDLITDESFFNYHFKLKKEDELFWEQWAADHPEKRSLIEEAQNTLQSLSLTLSEDEYNVQFEKIKAAININKEPSVFRYLSSDKDLQKRNRRRVRYLMPVLLVLVAVGGYLFFHHPNQAEKQLSVLANNGNEPMEFTLSDSTVVMLEPHSSLNYPAAFDGKERNVYLQGDAQFHVKRNETHPFKVYAGNIVATVLGTVFNIKQSADSAIVVELLKGSLNVEVQDSGAVRSILLSPSERAVYMRQDKKLYGDRINNHLIFNKNTFEEIAAQIKYAFGIKVVNESNKKDWRFTGEFKNTTAKDIIENICLVKGLTYVVNENTIVIK